MAYFNNLAVSGFASSESANNLTTPVPPDSLEPILIRCPVTARNFFQEHSMGVTIAVVLVAAIALIACIYGLSRLARRCHNKCVYGVHRLKKRSNTGQNDTEGHKDEIISIGTTDDALSDCGSDGIDEIMETMEKA